MVSDNTILPLLAPNSQATRQRQRNVQFYELIRFITRRRLKFYILSTILCTITILTLIHKSLISQHHTHTGNVELKQHNQNEYHKSYNFEPRTMRTIVGKYVGPKLDWFSNSSHLSQDLLNTNNYNPDPNLGKDGRPVYLPEYPKEQMQLLYSINRFNLVVSDKISVDRKLPDPRKLSCRHKEYKLTTLPNTSVIIVFHNEAWSTLVRTVHSILNTSPQHLLAEILLVDDASERSFLGKELEYYMNNLSSMRGVEIRVLRSSERIGLIRARLLGVARAVGQVLTFIDAHCEATSGWLEPLLELVGKHPNVAACPIIDIINEDNFAYTRSFELHLGAFNWGLNFRWYPISRREIISSNGQAVQYRKSSSNSSSNLQAKQKQGTKIITELIEPFNSPIMAGGLFSIDREYFNSIGQYDAQMDIWGGENIELSLRLWQCGGQVKIVPCSHVAHIFRKSSPYSFRPNKEVGDILYTNLARVAEVWMDSEWRAFFYAVNPIVNKTLVKVGRKRALANIESRRQLRQQLKCRSFKWFLENVWPEHFFPHDERFFGKINQQESGRCLERPVARAGSGQAPVGAANSSKCSRKFAAHQLFVFNATSGFVMSDENVCLDSGSDPIPSRQAIFAPCSESKRQKWHYTSELHLKHVASGLCLSLSNQANRVQLDTCNNSLKWTLSAEKWH